MALLVYLLALLGQPVAAPAPSDASPGAQPDGGGIPITPGPHQ